MDLKTQGMMGWKDIVRNDEVLNKSSASAEVADRTLFTSALRRIFSNR